MPFNVYGLVIVIAALAMMFVVPRLRSRLGLITQSGFRRISVGLALFLVTGVLQVLLGMPGFVNLFVPSVIYGLTALSQLALAAGIVVFVWGVALIVAAFRRIEEQKSDDEEWRTMYLQLQELSQQPFSFVEILNISVNQLLKRAEADGAAVLLFKDNTDELILAAFSNLPPEISKRLEKMHVGGDIFGRVQKLGRTQSLANVTEADAATAELLANSGFLSIVVFPLRARDRVLGSVALMSAKPFHFTARRATALNVASNHLATLLESVRNEKDITRLRDRLRPSEEAKRTTEELFFRRGLGSNLELREAVEFERVRKFFDADCIKLVFKDPDGEFRIKASSGGAETGLLLDRRKLGGIGRAIGERKLLLLTAPKSSPAGKGFDSMPRQTLFVPVPYPDREDLVLMLESEAAALEFSEEKLSAVRVASVYLVDLHFLFLAKRDGDRFKNSVAQLDWCLRRLAAIESREQAVNALSECSIKLLAHQVARVIALRAGAAGDDLHVDQSGLRWPSDVSRQRQNEILAALCKSLPNDNGERFATPADLASFVTLENQAPLERALHGLGNHLQVFALPVRSAEIDFGAVVLVFAGDNPTARENIDLVRRLADVAALRLSGTESAKSKSELSRTPQRERSNSGVHHLSDAGAALDEVFKSHRVDSNLDPHALRSGSEALPQALTALVDRLYSERRDQRLYFSSFDDDLHRYYQISISEFEMRRFRDRHLETRDWQPAVVAIDLPPEFRSLPAEYAVTRRSGQIETVTWRQHKASLNDTSLKPMNILGIDDQEVIRELLVNIITRMGHRITTTSSGQEALRLFRQESFDLVIAEAGLPDVSGWAIAEQVKRLTPRTPVIILSGWDALPESTGGTAPSADFVLTKPFKMEQLGKVIGAACEMIDAKA